MRNPVIRCKYIEVLRRRVPILSHKYLATWANIHDRNKTATTYLIFTNFHFALVIR